MFVFNLGVPIPLYTLQLPQEFGMCRIRAVQHFEFAIKFRDSFIIDPVGLVSDQCMPDQEVQGYLLVSQGGELPL